MPDRAAPAQRQRAPARLLDDTSNYGWISILLHWTSGAVIVTLWLLGLSVVSSIGTDRLALLNRHTSVAISFYALLWLRIAWRVAQGHPKPVNRRVRRLGLAHFTHVAILLVIAVMLVSGPLMAWSGALPVTVFGREVPSPIATDPWLFDQLHHVHHLGGVLLSLAIVLHLCGVVKHVVFNRDGALLRMVRPSRGDRREGEGR